MGVDLSGVGGECGFNWSAWRDILQVAVCFGWFPQGTIKLGYQDEPDRTFDLNSDDDLLLLEKEFGGDGGYCDNEGYIVKRQDAQRLARSLKMILEEPSHPIAKMKVNWALDTEEKLLRESTYIAEHPEDDKLPDIMIERLIKLAEAGPFRIY